MNFRDHDEATNCFLSTPSVDVVLDDGDQNVTYSSGWDSSPNGFEQNYYEHTMQ